MLNDESITVDDPKKTSPNPHQSLNKKEKRARSSIKLGFEWLDTSEAKTAKRLKDAYHGKYWTPSGNYDRFTVNTIFSLVQLLLPNLIYRQPHIIVKPLNPTYNKKLVDGTIQAVDMRRAATIREAALNHEYTKIGAFKEQRNAVLDSFFWGFGVTKVGNSFETVSSEDNDFITQDARFLRRIDPNDFGYYPLATGMDDTPFAIHRLMISKSRLKKNKNYSGVQDIQPSMPKHLIERTLHSKALMDYNELITVYEVHNYEDDYIYTFAGEEKKLINKMKNPYQFSGPHFSLMRFAWDNDKFQGIPLLANVEDEAVALNQIMTLMIDHFRKFPGQMIVQEGGIDEADIEQLRNGVQGSIHVVKDINAVRSQPPLSMGGEYFNIVTLLNGIIDRILGIPDFKRAGGSNRKSATEASFIQSDSTIRRQYFLDRVREFLLDGTSKIAGLQAQFQDEQLEISASGEMQGMPFKFDKSDIQGDFAYNFDIEELQAFNEAQSTQLNAALNILASHEILHPVLRELSPKRIAKAILKASGHTLESFQRGSDKVTLYVPPEEENQLSRKDAPMPNPKEGEDHRRHLQIHMDGLNEDKRRGFKNEQLLDHIVGHQMLMSKEEQEAQGGSAPANPNGPAPQGPGGPLGPLVSRLGGALAG